MVHAFRFLYDWGYGLTQNDDMDFVCGYLLRTNQSGLFKNDRPGKDWFYAFINRWSKEISRRKTHTIAFARAASCTQEIVDNYFEVVTKKYQLSGITSGCHIWNCDETGFCGDQGKATVVCRKGAKRVLKLTGNNQKIHHTVNNCCNADGYFTPPFVVYKAKRNFKAEWALGGPTGTKYSISKSGWMEHDTFIEWLKEVYIPECQAISGTHILHLDGHTSHVSLAAVMLCRENNIILICLPAHSTHILQPLDRDVYCHVKQVWKAVLTKY